MKVFLHISTDTMVHLHSRHTVSHLYIHMYIQYRATNEGEKSYARELRHKLQKTHWYSDLKRDPSFH